MMVRIVPPRPYIPARGQPDEVEMARSAKLPPRSSLAGILATTPAPAPHPTSQLAMILEGSMPTTGGAPLLGKPRPAIGAEAVGGGFDGEVAAGATLTPAAAGGLLSTAITDAFGGHPTATDTSGLPALRQHLASAKTKKPGFFQRGGVGEKVGNVLFSMVTGMPTPGARRHLEELAAQRQLLERVQQRQAERDEWVWREQWKRDHPDDQFTQYIQAAGIDPASPQGQALFRQRAESIATPPSVAVDSFDAQGNPTKTFMPRAGIGIGREASLLGPAPGTVTNGYRFRGGNPNDRNSWVPVGGAPSAGGATFR